MTVWLSPVLVVVALACQGTVLQGRLPAGLTPDLVFILTLAASRLAGSWTGTLLGWWAGLLTGALRGNLSLPMAFLYGSIGFLSGLYFERNRPRVLEVGLLVAGLTLLLAAGEGLLLRWLGLPLEPARSLVAPSLVFNVAVLTPLISLSRRPE